MFDFVASGVVHGSTAYDTYATNLLATGVYGLETGVPDAAVPPVYGFVLAGAYALFGRSALTVAVLHSACDMVSIAILWSIGVVLFQRTAVGVLAALFLAGYPYLVFQSLAVNDTALFIAELFVFLWLTLRLANRPLDDRGAVVTGCVAGLVLGLGLLTRPVLLLVAAAAASWLVLRRPGRATMRALGALALCSALAPGAWGLRNLIALGQPVLVATNGGSNFWQGNNPQTIAFLRAGYDVQWIPPGALGDLDHRDPESGRHFLSASLRFLRDHPTRIPELYWVKLRTHWSLDIAPRRNPAFNPGPGPDDEPDLGGVVVEEAVAAYSEPLFERVGRTLHRLTWGTALILACIGMIASRRRWRDLALILAAEASMTLFYVVFHPSTRYRVPGDPLLFLLSAAGLLAVAAAVGRVMTGSRGSESTSATSRRRA